MVKQFFKNLKKCNNNFHYFSLLFSFGSGVVLGILNGEPFSVLRSDDYVIVFAIVW